MLQARAAHAGCRSNAASPVSSMLEQVTADEMSLVVSAQANAYAYANADSSTAERFRLDDAASWIASPHQVD